MWERRYRGMEEDLVQLGLLETVGRQWSICVERALNDLAKVPAGRVQTLRYEERVPEPDARLRELWSFAEIDPRDVPDVTNFVETTHVGGHRVLGDEELQVAMRHLRAPGPTGLCQPQLSRDESVGATCDGRVGRTRW